MKLPSLQGVVERRLLVNYRVDADVAARLLPAPFRPRLFHGSSVAGICLIRLGKLRPTGAPTFVGLRSESAAHRFAVEWDTPDGTATGVWIPRRDTASLANVLVGGHLYPGEHHRARFRVDESDDRLRVGFESLDGSTSVDVSVDVVPDFDSELFGDVATASRFFEEGAVGWSATRQPGRHDGLQLDTDAWRVEPGRVAMARSSFFDDAHRFPPGSVALDCALVMRNVPVTWHALSPATAEASGSPATARTRAFERPAGSPVDDT